MRPHSQGRSSAESAFNCLEMGAAGARTQPSWAAEHSPPQQNLSSISSPSFSGKPSSPHAFCNLLFLPHQVAGPSLAALCVLSVVRAPRQRSGRDWRLPPSTPHSSPWLRPAAAAFRTRAPAGINTQGEERFLAARLSGALRQGSFPALRPPAPASQVRSWDWRRP